MQTTTTHWDRRLRAADSAYALLLDMGADVTWRLHLHTGRVHGPTNPTEEPTQVPTTVQSQSSADADPITYEVDESPEQVRAELQRAALIGSTNAYLHVGGIPLVLHPLSTRIVKEQS